MINYCGISCCLGPDILATCSVRKQRSWTFDCRVREREVGVAIKGLMHFLMGESRKVSRNHVRTTCYLYKDHTWSRQLHPGCFYRDVDIRCEFRVWNGRQRFERKHIENETTALCKVILVYNQQIARGTASSAYKI